jgi:hypothetical protein
LHYQVLEPVHLEFNVYDDSNNLVRVFSRDYTDPVSDLITWDGKDTSGRVVPDGQYRLAVFNYDFFVKVDTTPPSVSAAFDSIKIYQDPIEKGGEFHAHLSLFGLATDINIKKWLIESGEGDNPQAWTMFSEGSDDLADVDAQGDQKSITISDYQDYNIGFLKGRRFRITTEDFAGNRRSMLTGNVEEKIMFVALDKKNIVAPSEKIPILWLAAGTHELAGFETMRLPTDRLVLQYMVGSQWFDSQARLTSGAGGSFVMTWDTSPLDVESVVAIRMKVVDSSGGTSFSTEKPIDNSKTFTDSG